jgi:hypothetical protein
MRVILDLDEIVLGKLQFKADSEKRSRKNYMEVLLQNAANGQIVENKQLVYDSPKLPTTHQDEPMQWQDPTQPTQILDNFSKICQDISYADSKKEIEKYVAQAKRELDWKRLLQVQTFANETIEKKGFIYND